MRNLQDLCFCFKVEDVGNKYLLVDVCVPTTVLGFPMAHLILSHLIRVTGPFQKYAERGT